MSSDPVPPDSTLVQPGSSRRNALRVEACRFEVVEGPDRGREFHFKTPEMTLGKRQDNDIVLSDQLVSKQHMAIVENDQGLLLRDLGSTNGTFLENFRVQEAYLQPPCSIRIGATTIRFLALPAQVPLSVSHQQRFGPLVGASPSMQELFGTLEKVAPTELSVLILGETGTGKELVARAIHETSPRARHPFVVFDGSAVSRDLVESSLFGHRAGAYTGAVKSRQGAFLAADNGTLFIDEIGELPLDLQPRLLRVLERREIQPLGSDETVRVNVRVLAATHRNLKQMVKEGTFRQDLFYRISVVEVVNPSLRERTQDIPLLVAHFVGAQDGPALEVTEEAMKALQQFSWPGNVRELRNAVERARAFARGRVISMTDFSLPAIHEPTSTALPASVTGGDRSLDQIEADAILQTLLRTGWNRTKSAEILGITRQTLNAKIEKYALKR